MNKVQALVSLVLPAVSIALVVPFAHGDVICQDDFSMRTGGGPHANTMHERAEL